MKPTPTDCTLGFVRVSPREGGGYHFARHERERLTTALHANRSDDPRRPRWFEGEDNYGATILLDLDGVEAMCDTPPDCIGKRIADGFYADRSPENDEGPWTP